MMSDVNEVTGINRRIT